MDNDPTPHPTAAPTPVPTPARHALPAEGRVATPRLGRRHALGLLGAGVVALAACGSSGGGLTAATSTTASTADPDGSAGAGGDTTTTAGGDGGTAASATCTPIPQETAGPYPADGSNGPNVLAEDGVVRSDIRTSIGTASGTAEGVPLTIDLTVLDTSAGCAPMPGAAVYLWHCDRAGGYSMYSPGVDGENYLRGMQVADADGRLRFTSVFPAAYSGRWPHIHFEVFPSLDVATSGSNAVTTSQLAFPEGVCEQVYATDGYDQSVRNLATTSIDGDNVFGDGYDRQLATVTGSVGDGFVASLTVPV